MPLTFPRRAVLSAGLALAVTGALPALASDRFDGRTVEFIVGSQPGGGYDLAARFLAAQLEAALPGSNVVVANERRAGGLVALNRLAASPRPEPRVMMYNTGFLSSQIAGDPHLQADLTSFDYIGKMTSEARYLVVARHRGIESFEALQASGDRLLMPVQGRSSSGYIQGRLLGSVFALNLEPLTGFGGSEARAALAKGELDLDLVSESNVARLAKAEAADPILRFGPSADPALQAIPDAADFASSDDQALVVAHIAALAQLGRIVAAAPGMEADDLAALQAAFAQVMADPAVVAEAAAQGLPLNPLPGPETKALIEATLVGQERLVELLQKVGG